MKLSSMTGISLLAATFLASSIAAAQIALNPLSKPAANPLTDPTISPGTAFLFGLEAKFAADTATGRCPAAPT